MSHVAFNFPALLGSSYDSVENLALADCSFVRTKMHSFAELEFVLDGRLHLSQALRGPGRHVIVPVDDRRQVPLVVKEYASMGRAASETDLGKMRGEAFLPSSGCIPDTIKT